jgi:site-specific recombinase XerD
LAAKEKAGFRPDYIVSLRQIVGKFSESIPTDSIKDASIAAEVWLDSQPWVASTRRSNIGRIASFFTFCRKKRWVDHNPCDSIELPRVAYKRPFTFTQAQSDEIMEMTSKDFTDMLAFATLTLIVGLRPSEAQKTSWT